MTICCRLTLRQIISIRANRTRGRAEADGGSGGGWRCCLSRSTTGKISLVVIVVVIAKFYMLPSFFRSSMDISLSTMVPILCTIGMTTASILNGFGSALMPHANLVGMLLEPTPQVLIGQIEEDLEHAKKTLEVKCWLLEEVIQHRQSSRTSLLMASSFDKAVTTEEIQKSKQQIQEEILFLANLVGDMEDDICEMKSANLLAVEARTTSGRVRGVLGVILSIILVIRVLLAASSFQSSSVDYEDRQIADSSRRDLLTCLLMLLAGRNYITSAEQYDTFCQLTSLILAGALTISQVSSFFRVVGALERKISGTFAGYASSLGMAGGLHTSKGGCGIDVAVLTSSFVMGCYLLACVTTVKINLPNEYRSSFTSAVGGSNFSCIARLVNMIFFASASISAIALASLFSIQRKNLNRYRIGCGQISCSSATSLLSLA